MSDDPLLSGGGGGKEAGSSGQPPKIYSPKGNSNGGAKNTNQSSGRGHAFFTDAAMNGQPQASAWNEITQDQLKMLVDLGVKYGAYMDQPATQKLMDADVTLAAAVGLHKRLLGTIDNVIKERIENNKAFPYNQFQMRVGLLRFHSITVSPDGMTCRIVPM